MKNLYNRLLETTQDRELREWIITFRDRPHLINPTTNKFHPFLAYSFTRLGNMARDMGELKTAQTAREMRDEIKGYCSESIGDRQDYIEYVEE